MKAITLPEWSRADPTSHTVLRGLTLAGDAQRVVDNLATQGVMDVVQTHEGLTVQTRSFVGRLEVGPLSISIQPKVGGPLLLQLFRYAYAFSDLSLYGDAEFAAGELLPDLLVAQLRTEVTDLLARGLSRRYVRTAESLVSPRGRIDMPRFAAAGGLVTAGLPCVHHPRSLDILLNQVILAGLRLAADVVADRRLRRDMSRLAARLEDDVSAARIEGRTLDDAFRSISRLTTRYAAPLEIIRLLWEGAAISLDDGSVAHLPGFMFDMNRFFQRLLERFLTEYLPDYRVRSELPIRGMLTYVHGRNPKNRASPLPRPDFVLFRGKEQIGIFDAKYRDLWEMPLPRSMLYQLAMYALSSRDQRCAVMLYPTMDPAASDAVIAVREPLDGTPLGFVIARPVVLPALAAAIASKDASLAKKLVRLDAMLDDHQYPNSHSPYTFV